MLDSWSSYVLDATSKESVDAFWVNICIASLSEEMGEKKPQSKTYWDNSVEMLSILLHELWELKWNLGLFCDYKDHMLAELILVTAQVILLAFFSEWFLLFWSVINWCCL